MPTIHIIVADDHPLFRRGVINALSALPGMDIVGEAASGQETIQLARSAAPEVILLDIQMPDMSGLDTMRAIHTHNPAIRFLILTMFEDDATVYAAMRAGAHGYLLKGADQHELERAVRAIFSGGAIFSAPIAQTLLQQFTPPEPQPSTFYLPELTRREVQVLALIGQGRSNEQIANLLGLQLKSVRNNISVIFNKLQVTDRTAAIARAHEARLR